jgi:hypothetical protein
LSVRGVEGCEEPQFIRDESGTVGQPFSFTEGVECLPGEETWSSAVIYWGDGTTSPGTIMSVRSPSPEAGFTSVTVTGQHTYNQSGSFPITVAVTDQASQSYKGGWHTNALISPSSSPPPGTCPNGGCPPQKPYVPTPPAAPVCVVPALKGDTLNAARRALAKVHCRLGKVNRPRHRRGALVVTKQAPGRGKTLRGEAAVAVTLAPRPRGRRAALTAPMTHA